MTQQLRFVSYGGGVRSTTLPVLAAQCRIDFAMFVMANFGGGSEHPATLHYVRAVAAPCSLRGRDELTLAAIQPNLTPDRAADPSR